MEVIFQVDEVAKCAAYLICASGYHACRVVPTLPEETSNRAVDVFEQAFQPWPGKTVGVSQAVLDGCDLRLQTVVFFAPTLTDQLCRGRDLQRIERLIINHGHLGQYTSRDAAAAAMTFVEAPQIVRLLPSHHIWNDSQLIERHRHWKPSPVGSKTARSG